MVDADRKSGFPGGKQLVRTRQRVTPPGGANHGVMHSTTPARECTATEAPLGSVQRRWR